MIVHNVSQLEETKYRLHFRNNPRITESQANRLARDVFLVYAYLMTNGEIQIEPFHEIIAANFEAIAEGELQRYIISCAPRAGKSFLTGLALSWLMAKDGTTKHIMSSYGKALSNELFRQVYRHLLNPKLKEIFPEFKGFSPDRKYILADNGTVLVTSVGGELTGFTAGTPSINSKGIGLGVVDDALKSGNSIAELKTLRDWWVTQFSTRRTNRWANLIIGTRFSLVDLHGICMETEGLYHPEVNPKGWLWTNVKALCDNPHTDILGRTEVNQSFWESHPMFTSENLLHIKKAMGENAFSAMYQGEPIADSGSIFKPHWFKVISDVPHCDRYYLALDTAFSEKQGADESVITVLGVCGKRIYVIDQVSGRWDFPTLVHMTKSICKNYYTNHVVIEDKASGQSLIQVLKVESQLQVIPAKASTSKTTRLQQVLTLFEDNKVFFKEGPWNKKLSDQLTQFPLAMYDDCLDSLVHGLSYYQLFLSPNPTGINLSSNPRDLPSNILRRNPRFNTRLSLWDRKSDPLENSQKP